MADDDWARRGAFPVADGIYRIPLPVPTSGTRAVNVFAIETGESLVLIDSGWAHRSARRQLESSLASIGYGMRDIGRFLITHVHQDHYSQAADVRREFGARVSLGRGEAESVALLNAGARDASHANVEQLKETGAPHLAQAWAEVLCEQQNGTAWEQPDDWIDDGQALRFGSREIAAVATPGHTQGHLTFVDHDAGVLYGGDHLLSATTPVIGIEPATGPRPLASTLHSLRKVLRLTDLRLLPAHGPVLSSSHARARELLAHHDRRLARCLATVRSDKASAYDVALALAWTRNEKGLADLDDISAVMATLQTRAYLEHLSMTGSLERRAESGVVTYAHPTRATTAGPSPEGRPD